MKQIALRCGGWMFLGFAAIFLTMHLFGLSGNTWLRVLNGIVHLAGLWVALRMWLHQHPDEFDNYPAGVAMGMLTTLVAVIPFTVFLTLFLAYSPGLLSQIQGQTPLGSYLNPVTASLFVMVEGVVVGLIGSYVLMRAMEAMHLKNA
jgi:hypothetical protein